MPCSGGRSTLEGVSAAAPLDGEHPNITWNPCAHHLLMYSVTRLVQHGLVGICYTLGYNPLLMLFLWPQGALPVSPPLPLAHPPQCTFWGAHPSGTGRCSGPPSASPAWALNLPFLHGALVPSLEDGLRSQDLGAVCSLLLGP